jgi:hypothetical protein
MHMHRHTFWLVLTLAGNIAHAQWINYPSPGTPRTRDGKPDLSARAPRGSNGKPDLSGIWHVVPTKMDEWVRLFGNNPDTLDVPGMELTTISKYARNLFIDLKPEDVPERPAAVEARRQRLQTGVRDNPSLHCLPHGIPIQGLVSEPNKIVQTPGLMVILYEADATHRQIYTDGRPLPKDPQPAWLGYSVGRWEGDTMVVETAGFNDKSWLDLSGHSHGEALRVTERYRRRDFGHLDVEITFDDPVMYTRPFSIKFTQVLQADTDLLEFICNENEKDRTHLGLR